MTQSLLTLNRGEVVSLSFLPRPQWLLWWITPGVSLPSYPSGFRSWWRVSQYKLVTEARETTLQIDSSSQQRREREEMNRVWLLWGVQWGVQPHHSTDEHYEQGHCDRSRCSGNPRANINLDHVAVGHESGEQGRIQQNIGQVMGAICASIEYRHVLCRL